MPKNRNSSVLRCKKVAKQLQKQNVTSQEIQDLLRKFSKSDGRLLSHFLHNYTNYDEILDTWTSALPYETLKFCLYDVAREMLSRY
jgi:hypothetical protein